MSSRKLQAIRTTAPVTDPYRVEESYATEVIVNVRDGVAHVTFVAVRPSGVDPDGVTTEERFVSARVVMSLKAAADMAKCIERVQTTAQKGREAVHAPQPAARPN